MGNYSELLKDPRWQKKRLEIMQRDNFTCQACFSTTKTLHIHHLAYDGAYPWETPDDKLVTLCEFCHKRAENTKELISFQGLSGLLKVKIFDEMLDNEEYFETILQVYRVRKIYEDKREQARLLKEGEDLI